MHALRLCLVIKSIMLSINFADAYDIMPYIKCRTWGMGSIFLKWHGSISQFILRICMHVFNSIAHIQLEPWYRNWNKKGGYVNNMLMICDIPGETVLPQTLVIELFLWPIISSCLSPLWHTNHASCTGVESVAYLITINCYKDKIYEQCCA